MPQASHNKPYRVRRARTGLGLFATDLIKKGTDIIEYTGPLLDCDTKKGASVSNKYLFEINKRWAIDGSVRTNTARYINHACKPNAECIISPRKRTVTIRASKNIHEGDEINYNYGKPYFNEYIKPIGCKCTSCIKKRRAVAQKNAAK